MLNTLMIKTHQLPINHQLDSLTKLNQSLGSLLVNSIEEIDLVTNNKFHKDNTHNIYKAVHNIIHNNMEPILGNKLL